MTNNNKKISGCGVLLFYKNNNGKFRVFLIKEKRGIYNDIGGGKDAGETEIDTIKREIQEESRGLFDLSKVADKIFYVDVKSTNNSYYRSFGVFLDISESDILKIKSKYFENMNIIDKDKTYKTTWKETIDIHSFDIDTLLKGNNHSSVKYIDTDKKFYMIGMRPLNGLVAMFTNDKILNKITSVKYKLEYGSNKVKNKISIVSK